MSLTPADVLEDITVAPTHDPKCEEHFSDSPGLLYQHSGGTELGFLYEFFKLSSHFVGPKFLHASIQGSSWFNCFGIWCQDHVHPVPPLLDGMDFTCNFFFFISNSSIEV